LLPADDIQTGYWRCSRHFIDCDHRMQIAALWQCLAEQVESFSRGDQYPDITIIQDISDLLSLKQRIDGNECSFCGRCPKQGNNSFEPFFKVNRHAFSSTKS